MNQLTIEILSRILSIILIVIIMYIFYKVSKRMAIKNIEKAKDAYICPKCGSLRLAITDKLPSPAKFIASVPAQNFICADCEYEGIAPKIDNNQIEKFRKELKKQQSF